MSWKIYVIHFSRRYKHARHYTGIAEDVEKRYSRHLSGQGARLIAVALAAGVRMSKPHVLAEYPDYSTAHMHERRYKNRGGASRFCTICRKGRR